MKWIRVLFGNIDNLYSASVMPCFCDISHPFDTSIIALLDHLQESHLKAGGSEHGNMEFHGDWRTRPLALYIHS